MVIWNVWEVFVPAPAGVLCHRWFCVHGAAIFYLFFWPKVGVSFMSPKVRFLINLPGLAVKMGGSGLLINLREIMYLKKKKCLLTDNFRKNRAVFDKIFLLVPFLRVPIRTP